MRLIILSAAMMLLLAAYIVSPYIAVHRIEGAIERRDAVSLEGYADWPAIREQLRVDLKSTANDLAKQASRETDGGAGSLLAEGLAALLVPTMVDRFVDSNVSSYGIIKLIDERNKLEQNRRGFATRGAFSGPFDFRVDLRNLDHPDAPTTTALMEFNAHGWRVTRLMLPLQYFAKVLEAEAAKAAPKSEPIIKSEPMIKLSEESDLIIRRSELMIPGPLPEMALGSTDAPNTIIEYTSMTCPNCAQFQNEVLPQLKTKYIDTGKVIFMLREFPLDNLAAAAFMLARCSGDDRYYPMVDAMFATQESWVVPGADGKEQLLKIARQVGMSKEEFDKCLVNEDLFKKIVDTRTMANDKFQVDSTPTFFINGKRLTGDHQLKDFEAALGESLSPPAANGNQTKTKGSTTPPAR